MYAVACIWILFYYAFGETFCFTSTDTVMLEQTGEVSEVTFEISRFIFYDFNNTYPYVFDRNKYFVILVD